MECREPSLPDVDAGRRHANECRVEYFLFIIDRRADGRRLTEQLGALQKAALELCRSLADNYIWQRDEFRLELKTGQGQAFLYGATDYGDAVEDEWLIVYMLRELTKTFRHLWVRVADSDGEFLLIEAAGVLPAWISPDTDENRVWIHDSKLLIIPSSSAQDHQPGQLPQQGAISLRTAVEFLKSKPSALVHSPMMESEAFYRLEKYPEHIVSSAHHSLVTIPRTLAYVLHELPKSISMAVESFYLRDVVALKQIMSVSGPLTFPPEDLVTTSVQFSRVLFAQLKSQRFEPPPRWKALFETAYSSSNGKRLPRLEMGMKLTCGYEILSKRAHQSRHRVVQQLGILLQDLAEDGPGVLPTDREIRSWPNQERNDDEGWMEIDFDEFERGLAQQGAPGQSKTEESARPGNSQIQTDLSKMVSRFEAFLNDDKSGLDGASIDGEGNDDEAEMSDEDSEYEDKIISFDDEEFAKMMRDMMGLPDQGAGSTSAVALGEPHNTLPPSAQGLDDDSGELQQLSLQLEAELKQNGALNLVSDAGRRPMPTQASRRDAVRQVKATVDPEDGEGIVDVDYHLAQNILESFKGQAGMAGPAGNLLGMMGLTLPRDDEDES